MPAPTRSRCSAVHTPGLRQCRLVAAASVTALAALAVMPPPAQAQAPSTPMPVPAKADPMAPQTRSASLPAKGLFEGDKLSAAARAKLTDIVIEATGLDVEVALLVPVGPWIIDGGGHTDRDLTEKRLNAVRGFLTERGIEPKRIFVESRTDAKIKEPRLDVQLVGRPALN